MIIVKNLEQWLNEDNYTGFQEPAVTFWYKGDEGNIQTLNKD